MDIVMTDYAGLFKRYEGNPILTVKNWPYRANAVFNAGATIVNGQTLLLVRVEDRRGISHLTVARSNDGISNWHIDPEPTLPAEPVNYPEEAWGVEDPRITFLSDIDAYVITYTAYSRIGPLVALAQTKDFCTFIRSGCIMLPENKDAALFPVKFNNRWAMLHRPVPGSAGGAAHIWISYSPDLKHWGDHRILIRARSGGWWDANKIGLSPPPLQTRDGWLILYHGVKMTAGGAIYRLGFALLDLEHPQLVLRRSDEWVFGPEEWYEREGDVNKVVFPCGWILKNDELRIYYGGADSCIALVTATLTKVLEYVNHCPAVSRQDEGF